MSTATQRALPSDKPAWTQGGVGASRKPGRPFFGLIDSVLVSAPSQFAFEGAIPHDDAAAVWTWVVREVAPDLIDPEVTEADPSAVAALIALVPDILTRTRDILASAATSTEVERRLRVQIGSETAWERLPRVLMALRCRAALDKAQTFGRAANGMHDDASLAMALQSMPLQERAITALLMQAAVGQVANPSRLMTAAIRLAGGASEATLTRAGFAPLIEALLAHAQDQVPHLSQAGAFADMDLVCRAVDRYHRLVRAAHYVEISRGSRWLSILSALTKAVSERLEPRVREVGPDVNKALRRPHQGADRVDADQLLVALNGVFLLATVRDCRDSLALNAVFDQTWNQVGQALEMHIERQLESIRQNPSDKPTIARLDAALKMAELRFGAEYAEILKRARDSAERRQGT